MYKKLLLVFLSIMALSTAKAQTEKGNQSLGLNFGFNKGSSTSSTFDPYVNGYVPMKSEHTTYSIAPAYSYFIADKLDLGFSVAYLNAKQTNAYTYPNAEAMKINSIIGAVQLRKYFLYDNKIGIRTGPYVSYARYSESYRFGNAMQTDNNATSNIYTGGVGLDFVYYPIKKLGLAAALGDISYKHQKANGRNEGTANNFNLSFVNSLSLSVNYVFGN